MSSRRTTRSTRPRWRRSTLFAVSAVAAAAMIPASASAGWSTIDGTGGTTPAGHGSAPDEAASNGDAAYGVGGYTMTETASTIPNGGGSCDWTVRGRLIVRNPTVDGLADGDPLEGVMVKVSGRSSAGAALGDAGYNEWGTDTTDADGNFSVAEDVCGERRVKIEAKFDGDHLRVEGPSSPVWYELHDTLDEIDPSVIDARNEPFGGESGQQSTTQARTDAQTWIVYRTAIDRLAAIGQSLLVDTTVHNPATLTAPVDSWADTVFHGIHISPRDTESLDTMLHELGHIWAYPRETGEGCLPTALLQDASTHDQVEQPCVAFNEGFADFFSNKLERLMMANDGIASSESNEEDSVTPLNRSELKSKQLVSLTSLEQNELGWDQVFRVLTSADITRVLFGPGFGNFGVGYYTGLGCTGMPVGQSDLADALTVIGSSVSQLNLQDPTDPSVSDLFNRAADRLGSFDGWDAIAYTNAVDPNQTSEPHSAYGC
jgi:hypothetical protein